MKKLIPLALVAVVLACGRPSTSDRFSFDGTGDPDVPEGNIILGKFAGNIEITRWETPFAGYQSLTGPDLPLVQAIFNKKPIEGLAGLQLLVVYTQPPMRFDDPRRIDIDGAACYIDRGVFPVLGGDLVTVDIGEEFQLAWAAGGANRQDVIRDPDDVYVNPQADLIFYISDFDAIPASFPYDADFDMDWDGGSLGFRGYPTAPAGEFDEAIHFPEEVMGPGGTGEPTINGLVVTSAAIPAADEYRIEWEPSASNEHLVGMNVTIQLYGPADLGDPGSPQVNDLPYFNRIAQLVCSIDDGDGDFTFTQADLDNLLAVARGTQAYAASTEDVNEDGVCEPLTAPLPGQPPQGEDANGDGDCDDKIYGAALIVNRRTENVITPVLNDGPAPVYVSGNATKYYPIEWTITE